MPRPHPTGRRPAHPPFQDRGSAPSRSVVGLIAALAVALLGGPRSAGAATEHATVLGNGLTVVVRSLPPQDPAPPVALVLLLRVGEHHDPEGRSGLAHLCEHCFVTCAAGGAPARTYAEVAARYPAGHTAQTADLQTVLGMVAPAAALEAEVADLAARLGGLTVTDADLAREVPRVLDEVATMFERVPALAAPNRARERALPNPAGGRRAGLPAHLEALTRAEVQAFLDAHYRAGNAVLALTGPVDGPATLALLTKALGGLPSGKPPVRRPCPAVPRPTPIDVHVAQGAPPGSAGQVTLAYPAPPPGSPDYAPFLLLAARLHDPRAAEGAPRPLVFAPLDDPGVLYVNAPLVAGQSPEDAVAALQRRVGERVTAPFRPADPLQAANLFGLFTGMLPLSDASAAANPYLASLTLAFQRAHALDGAALRRSLLALKSAPLASLAARLFDPLSAGAAVVRASSDAGPR